MLFIPSCMFSHPKPWNLIKTMILLARTPILPFSLYCISLLMKKDTSFCEGCFLLCAGFRLVWDFLTWPRLFSFPPLSPKTLCRSSNCLDLINKGRFTMPFLTLPYRKVYSESCCSCHLFQKHLEAELFIWSSAGEKTHSETKWKWPKQCQVNRES